MSQKPNNFRQDIYTALLCTCPHCAKGSLYTSRYSFSLNEKCDSCGFPIAKNDSADGPAVFLLFIIMAIVIPAALIVDVMYQPPIWVHAVLWTGLTVGLSLLTLKPVKAYVIALQYRHRPEDFK